MRRCFGALILANALFAPLNVAALECTTILDRKVPIDENAQCNPGGTMSKECDAHYKAPSKEWVACYQTISDCRASIQKQNELITACQRQQKIDDDQAKRDTQRAQAAQCYDDQETCLSACERQELSDSQRLLGDCRQQCKSSTGTPRRCFNLKQPAGTVLEPTRIPAPR